MALSTTQYGYIIDQMVPFTDDKGKTIKNGFVRVFVAGSSTPVVTYRNFDGATNQDRIELDNSGRTMTSVIGSKGLTYKVCVYDKHHSQESPILTVDKVSVIGANITAGSGSTLVTGLDGLTTKPDGFVDVSVVGTDGYVALDHTLVEDDLDTDAKVTAVEDDRYIPLLNEDVNDPDSKMTLGRLWKWVLGNIKRLSTTITTFRTGDVIPVDGPDGTAKMSKDDLLKETAKYAAKNAVVVQKSLSDYDFQPYFIQPTGVDISSTTRKRTRFIYAVGGGNVSVVCKGYDFRISFFNTNMTGSSYIVDAARDENQNWQDGDKGLQVDVPDGAINFIVSVRRKDNGTFTSSDRPEAIVSMFGQTGYMKKIYNSSKLFEDSTSSIITTPTRIDKTSVDKKNYVAVTVPSGYKARVLQCNQATTFGGNIDAGDWHTDNFVQAFYLRANFYCVQLKKTDESDINDYDYFGCKIVETNSPVYGKVVSFLGDSITTFGGSTSDPDNARYAQVGDPTYVGNRCRYPQTSLGIANSESIYTYWMRLVRYCGLKLGISESWAGSMISNTQATDSGDYGPNRCISSQTRIDHLAVNGTPDVIIVYGGTNDGYRDVAVGTFNTESPKDYTDEQIAALPVATFADACRAMMIRLQKTYPSARIIVILPNYANSIYTPQELDPYCDMLKEVCDYFGVKYVDIRTSGITMFNASTYLNDGIHPNKNGMQLIANAIFESGVLG